MGASVKYPKVSHIAFLKIN